jgi:hypothetical protein
LIRSRLSRLGAPIVVLVVGGLVAVLLDGPGVATQSGETDAPLSRGLDCPGGLDGVVSADFAWARAEAPTPSAALRQFVPRWFPSLSAEDFVREEPDLEDTGHLPPRDLARFVYYRVGTKLADLNLERWRQPTEGWIVHSYVACKSVEEEPKPIRE